MGKSKRKPYASVTGQESNKYDKRLANRRFRRHNKNAILSGKEVFYRLRECSDVWNFNSDGLDDYIPGGSWEQNENYIKEIQRK